MIDLFLVLFLTSGRSHSSIAALVPPQHSLGQICVQVLQFSVLPGCLFLLSLFLRRSTASNRLWAPKPIVAGTLMVLACRLSTRSAGVSYSLVPSSWLQLCTIHLQASSKRQQRDTPQATRSQTGLQSQGYTTHTANTHWNAQHPHCTNRFPQGVFNDYRTIQRIHYKFPCSATNLPH